LRLLFVVQRFGQEVLGGAETAARQYAVRLLQRGHDVHVLSSCATSYVDWADVYPPGEQLVQGLTVHRLPVLRPRDNHLFGALSARVLGRPTTVPIWLQREWMRQQGPYLPGLEPWLLEHSCGFDAAIFVTYLYYTTWAGLAACRAPSVLVSTAHDEPPLRLPLFDGVFRMPDAFGFLTEEEAQLVARRFRIRQPGRVLGIGVDPRPGSVDDFRERMGLGDRPYLVYAGRIDPSKGAMELYDMFRRYKRRRPGPLALVMVGEEVVKVPPHPDVLRAGFVDDATKDAAILGARLLVHPSYFESFSMVLTEALAQGVPAVVQRRCEVLLGQARRSGAAIPYQGYPQFEAALDLLLGDEALRQRMGAAGRSWARSVYGWEPVMDRVEELIDCARAAAR
jgi:glycosyltransferase involved in cell wall biosynthesis